MIVAAAAKVCNRRVASLVVAWARDSLGHNGDIAHSDRTEDSPVALHFGGQTERFAVIIRKLYGRAAIRARHFADQADGVESAAALRIAATKIVSQQGAPPGAEANAASGSPLAAIEKVWRRAEISSGCALRHYAAVVCMQAQYIVDVKRVG